MATQYVDLNLFMERASISEFVYQATTVRNHIFHVLGTPRRQRPMRSRFGSFLHSLLFRPLGKETAAAITQEIYSAINDPENGLTSRVAMSFGDIVVKPDKRTGTYYVNLDYLNLELNVHETHQFSLNKPGT